MKHIFFPRLAVQCIYPLFVLLLALGLGVRGLVRRAAGGARWDQMVRSLERLALTALLLAMLGFGVLQIVLRNFFHTGLIWIDPLLRHLVLWIGFTAAVVAAGRLRHIQMDVVGRLLPAGPRLWVLRLTTLAAASICMVLARAAWVYLGLTAIEAPAPAVYVVAAASAVVLRLAALKWNLRLSRRRPGDEDVRNPPDA